MEERKIILKKIGCLASSKKCNKSNLFYTFTLETRWKVVYNTNK